MDGTILTINGGSSSIKFALFSAGDATARILSGQIERIGSASSSLSVKDADGQSSNSRPIDAPDYASAVEHLIDWLRQQPLANSIVAIGHRIVHGGERYRATCLVDAGLITELKRLSPLDPAHLPGEIHLIEAFSQNFPALRQVACFDTAFHATLPPVAWMLPVPRKYAAQGVRRYGFHGLSYTYLMQELTRLAGAEVAAGRVILAHLGAGASMAAVRNGKCIDTTMAFTPTAGLVMGTRSGDLDPGLMIYLLREEGMNADQLDDLVNRRSGLLGISETSSDVRELLARESSDPRAVEALAIFCYQAKKWIGALATTLGGVDTLVFAGGIGENAAEIRARICEGLEFLGIRLDERRNAGGAAIISRDESPASVRVIRTDEERLTAAEVRRLVGQQVPH
jgi:acetate kinase